ncbi:MAG TPA: hypothetical protein VFS67_05165 [Polyangiaceae bacterium]|nr:hypothetical protein [Polyangiaceae bacterium]
MKSRVCQVVNWLLMSGLVLSGAGALTSGCATQQSTAQALTIAGAAAVLVGASLAADDNCSASLEGVGAYCSPGLSKGTRRAGTAMAVAGVGVAAAGYALQPRGPDRRSAPAPAPRAPAEPYRLIRATPAQEDPSDPSEPEPSDPSDPDPSDPSEPADPSEPIGL